MNSTTPPLSSSWSNRVLSASAKITLPGSWSSSTYIGSKWKARPLSKRTIITTVDDLDGTLLEPGHGETVRFAIDGRRYEIDLTVENVAALRDRLRPFIEASRRVSVVAPRRGRK